ncbi:hypothetical protein CEK28_04995 [Xenophilus sp. AP218F]|nr:hypothetical protein CEK28_04995 [Xenophilus sp. AP218F]
MQNQAPQAFEQFLKMPPSERVAYLQGKPIETRQQAVMNGLAKVGDPAAVSVFHQAVVGGVPLAGWHLTPALARQAAMGFIDEWDGEM